MVLHMGLMLLRLIVSDKQLAILAITPRQLLSGANDVYVAPQSVAFVEDGVHLLQGPVRGLRVEEVHGRDHERVDHGEDDVGLVSDVVECYGCDH